MTKYLLRCDITYQCCHFWWLPHTQLALETPCQCKFSLLASFTTVPFSQLRVMDSGAHQGTKGMKKVLIRSYLYSSVLQIQSLMTLRSCCTVNTKIILKTVTGSFCVWWYLGSVLAWFYYIVFVWCFIDKELRQCGQTAGSDFARMMLLIWDKMVSEREAWHSVHTQRFMQTQFMTEHSHRRKKCYLIKKKKMCIQ